MAINNIPNLFQPRVSGFNSTPNLFNIDQAQVQQAIDQKKINDGLAEQEQRKRADQSMKLQQFADTMRMVNANKSGNYGASKIFSDRMAQRKLLAEQKQKEALLKTQQNEFVKNNPQYRNAIKLNTLFPGLKLPTAKDRKIILQNGIQYYADTGEPVLPNAPSPKPPKTTKSDFVVDILQNIKNHVPTEDEPTYELSKSEQNILDTISATDPLEIYKRSIYNQIGLSDPFSDIPTIINEEDGIYEKLNNGDKFIFNGIEYTKGE
jgi:hypothetical protein